ncbi:MAG TPA: sigma-70 family RNA polymerase sigma factor [Kofleriaceae bacterium]|jgi:RNA polymerase sigma-70 factor (ECF subfamily)
MEPAAASVDRLLAASGAPASETTVADREAIATAWAGFLRTAKLAWPDVKLDEDELAAFVGTRLDRRDLAAALASAPAGDLALASACLAQEPTAHAAFDAVLSEVDAAAATTRSGRDLADEVKQILRVQLLVARPDRAAGIAGYRGRGPLRGWVRITATRELIRQQKKRRRDTPLEGGGTAATGRSLDEVLGGASDPMLSQLKAEYRGEFAVALREAIANLSAEDRTLLRQQVAQGMSIDEIGAAFGVHRATAARWLNRARGALVAATRAALATRLRLPVDEIDSVIRLVQSRLDASVVRYLGKDD